MTEGGPALASGRLLHLPQEQQHSKPQSIAEMISQLRGQMETYRENNIVSILMHRTCRRILQKGRGKEIH